MTEKIRLCEPDIGDREIRYVAEAIKNREVSSGAPPVGRFEEAFAKFFGARHAVATNSGGSALFLALKALGIGPGDEVIAPTFTMVATAEAVSHCGATPVFADAGASSPNIDAASIERLITPRTKAIMIAHLFGIPCDMDRIMKLAHDRRLPVVEDAAEAHGARWRGKLAGTFGAAGCFSFYASKVMTAGEGGMIVTDDDRLAALARRLREYDIDPRRPYVHELIAWNLRLPALSAAVGLAQLERLPELIEKRNAVARRYAEAFEGLPQIKKFIAPPEAEISTWLATFLAERRDELVAQLAAAGIEAKRVFVPMHELPIYKQSGNFPNAEYIAARGISLPSASTLSPEDQACVINDVKKFYGK